MVRLIASISRLVPCQRGSLTSCYLVILSSLPTHYHLAAYMRNCANTHYRALSVATELPSGSQSFNQSNSVSRFFFCLLFDPRLAPCKASYCLQPARSQLCHENTYLATAVSTTQESRMKRTVSAVMLTPFFRHPGVVERFFGTDSWLRQRASAP